ncbi:MAG TPA: hypothetical protein VKU40_19715 [Thermoanaerobaculia bacterium]|nr:hypothetical protein [Thermoanaerobaculia bacterium]
MSGEVETLLSKLGDGPAAPLYLVAGELVLAEPAAERLALALAERAGCRLQTHRRPPSLAPLLQDLRTFSLFEPAKVLFASDTALVADKKAAADLVDEAAAVLPLSVDESNAGELSGAEREAASRLLQALRLFSIDPLAGEPEAAVGDLPSWALEGGAAFRRSRKGRGRGKNQVAELSEGLGALLAAARAADLAGYAEGEVSELSSLATGSAPDGHTLVLAERSADKDHPLVKALAKQGAVLRVGELAEGRRGWEGLELLAEELAGQTGVGIEPGALQELARRTLRGDSDRKSKGADRDSTSRFAGEYRKLANLAAARGDARIRRALVDDAVTDRGEEDVFKLLDAIGEGRPDEALGRLSRHLGGADDALAARLQFFALLAGFCRNLTAVRGLLEFHGVRPGESNYGRFKSSLAPKLGAELPGGRKSPVAGMHPFRLHRAYLAAGRLPRGVAEKLPAWVLETELEIKGESSDPDVALSHLVARLAGAMRSGGGRRA